MRIAGVRIEEYRVPLSAADARRRWAERRGLLLRLSDEDGRVGQGEAAPLPGVSVDDLDGCRRALDEIAGRGVVEIDEVPDVALFDLPPAAAFAFETAVLDLVGQRSGRSLAQQFVAWPATVPLAALVTGESADARLDAAREAIAHGIRTLKLKVGRDLAAEIGAIRRVREAVGADVALRFDANGVWGVEEARSHLAALADLRPEFVEDPVSPQDWPDLGPVPVPLAVDEALGTRYEAAALAAAGVRVVVLKPTRLGGLGACRRRAAGIDVVLGHLYEGPIAIAAAAELALTLPRVRACGLDRHEAIAAWGAVPRQIRADHLATAGPGLGLPCLRVPA